MEIFGFLAHLSLFAFIRGKMAAAGETIIINNQSKEYEREREERNNRVSFAVEMHRQDENNDDEENCISFS
jgi:hypothetical protein